MRPGPLDKSIPPGQKHKEIRHPIGTQKQSQKTQNIYFEDKLGHKNRRNSTNQSKIGNRKQKIPSKTLFLPKKQRNPPKTPLSPSVTKCRQVSRSVAKVSPSVVKCREMSRNVTKCQSVSCQPQRRLPASPLVVMVYCLCRKSPKQSFCKLITRWQQD